MLASTTNVEMSRLFIFRTHKKMNLVALATLLEVAARHCPESFEDASDVGQAQPVQH